MKLNNTKNLFSLNVIPTASANKHAADKTNFISKVVINFGELSSSSVGFAFLPSPSTLKTNINLLLLARMVKKHTLDLKVATHKYVFSGIARLRCELNGDFESI